mmetsp:Transcript_16186/g.46500  ORF Transcript_16186/g.46500 Transcript_16186/m.46500 type:complete len:235 (-) Transcript_16186:265-969(-)
MYDILGVHIDQSARHLVDNLTGLFLIERALGHDVIKQFSTAHEFHDDVYLFIGNVHIIQRDNVGMVQTPQSLDFGVELLNHSRESLLDMLLVDDLTRIGLSIGPANAAVTGGGGTDAEDFADFILFIQLLLGVRSLVHHSAGRPPPAPAAGPVVDIGTGFLLQPTVTTHEQRRLMRLAILRAALLPPIAQFGSEEGCAEEVRCGLLGFGAGFISWVAKGEEGAFAVLVFGIAAF